MPTESLDMLEHRIADLYGEESLAGEIVERLGRAYPLAQQFQERAQQYSEELFAQAKRALEALTSRRAKLLERFRVGGDWGDMDEVREQLEEMADELADQLGEATEAYMDLLETQRTEIEEQHQKELTGTRDWRVFQHWIDEKMDLAQELADALIEQFEEESAIFSRT